MGSFREGSGSTWAAHSAAPFDESDQSLFRTCLSPNGCAWREGFRQALGMYVNQNVCRSAPSKDNWACLVHRNDLWT